MDYREKIIEIINKIERKEVEVEEKEKKGVEFRKG